MSRNMVLVLAAKDNGKGAYDAIKVMRVRKARHEKLRKDFENFACSWATRRSRISPVPFRITSKMQSLADAMNELAAVQKFPRGAIYIGTHTWRAPLRCY